MPFPNKTLAKVSKERLREITSKGGKTVTAKQRMSQKIRQLKKKGVTDAGAKEILLMLEDPEYTSADRLTIIKRIQIMVGEDPDQLGKVVKMLDDWHKTHHGTKNINHNNNLNIDVELTAEEMDELIKRTGGYEK